MINVGGEMLLSSLVFKLGTDPSDFFEEKNSFVMKTITLKLNMKRSFYKRSFLKSSSFRYRSL